MFSKEEKISFVKEWKSEIGAEILDMESWDDIENFKLPELKTLEIKKEILEEWIRLREFLKAYEE